MKADRSCTVSETLFEVSEAIGQQLFFLGAIFDFSGAQMKNISFKMSRFRNTPLNIPMPYTYVEATYKTTRQCYAKTRCVTKLDEDDRKELKTQYGTLQNTLKNPKNGVKQQCF